MSLLDDVSIVVTPNGYKAGTLYGVLPTATLGSELLSQPVDLTTDFVANGGGVIVDADTFTSAGGTFDGLVSSTNTFEIGKRYKLIISGNTTSSGFGFYPASGSGFYGDGFGTHYFTATHEKLWVRQQTSGTTNITSFSIKEFTASDMSVTRATAATRVDENGLVNYAEVLGSELVTNGDYSSGDAGWSTSSGWTFNNIDASFDGLAYQPIRQDVGLVTGKIYKITFTLNISSGNMFFQLGGGSTSYTTSDTYTIYEEATSHATLSAFISIFSTISSVFTIDNVSVKQADLNNVPRIDYTGGGCPHILSEPQRTNLITYSEDFSQWTTKNNAVVTTNQTTSPIGTLTADKITFDGTQDGRVQQTISVTNGNTYTQSVYLKNNNLSDVTQVWIGFSAATQGQFITITNEWQRYSVTVVADSSSEFPRVQFSGTGSLFAWGTQLEEGSYATSYIPTSGSTVTRNQDQFTRDGISSLINSTEGVLFAEIAALSDDNTGRYYSLSDGTSSNRIRIGYSFTDNTIRALVISQGNTAFDYTHTTSDIKLFSKVAFSYKQDDFSFWIDGVEVHSDTSGNTPTALSRLSFDDGKISGTGGYFYGKVKQLQVYDTTLTDNQLIQLTGEAGTHFFESYSEMAETLTYTIQ
jgi:hypothetical protein